MNKEELDRVVEIINLYSADCPYEFSELVNLAKLGNSLENFKNGTGITKNCYGDWVITVHDGEDWRILVDSVSGETLFRTPQAAINSMINKYA